MSERSPLYGQGAFGIFIVTARDGHMFRCSVELIGDVTPERRWIFEDAATRHVGPPFFPLDYLDELVPIVSDWWDQKKALGYEGVNADVMRDRLVRQIQRDDELN